MTLARAEKTRLPRRLPHPAAARSPRAPGGGASLTSRSRRGPASVPLDGGGGRVRAARMGHADALEAMIRAGEIIKRHGRVEERVLAAMAAAMSAPAAAGAVVAGANASAKDGARTHRAGPGAGVRARRRRGPTRQMGALRRPERGGRADARLGAARAVRERPPPRRPEFRRANPLPLGRSRPARYLVSGHRSLRRRKHPSSVAERRKRRR